MFTELDIKTSPKPTKRVQNYLSSRNKTHFADGRHKERITRMLLGDEYYNHSKVIDELIDP